MKSIAKIAVSAICLFLTLVTAAVFAAGCGFTRDSENVEITLPDPVVVRPEPYDAVKSVSVLYNGTAASVIEADIAAGVINLTASVIKDDGADGSVTWSSDAPAVASVNAGGVVSLNATGVAAITATAGSKSASVVITVSDMASESRTYTLTVSGGTASVGGAAATAAKAGDYVELTPTLPEGMTFDKWVLTTGETQRDLHSHGFVMPSGDVSVTLVLKAREYTLNLVGGQLYEAGKPVDGTDGGVSIDNEPVMRYSVASGSSVTVVADDTAAGYMFVGWDLNYANQRTGGAGQKEYTFAMPAEDTTLFAVNSKELGAMLNPGRADRYKKFNSTEKGFGEIVNGVAPGGSVADPDLEGLSGYRLAIPADTTGSTAFAENIEDTTALNTMNGAQTVKVIFKNHSNKYDVSVDFGASFNDNRANTGTVTVPKGETVTVCFEAAIGFANPWASINVRTDIGGSGSETVLLDMVTMRAATYPNGDPFINRTNGKPVILNAAGIQDGNLGSGGSFGNVRNYFMICYINGSKSGSVAFEVTNMPAYDTITPDTDGKRYTTIYVQVRSNVNYDFVRRVGFGKDMYPMQSSENTVFAEFHTTTKDDVSLLALKIERTPDDASEKFYISYIHDSPELGGISGGRSNFTLAFYYNNVIGYGGEV